MENVKKEGILICTLKKKSKLGIQTNSTNR